VDIQGFRVPSVYFRQVIFHSVSLGLIISGNLPPQYPLIPLNNNS
jgi:hypothetical protein